MQHRTRTLAAVLSTTTLGLFAGGVAIAGPAAAINPCQSSNPPEYCYTDPDPGPAVPGAPGSLTAVSVLQSDVTLSWTDASGAQTSYFVRRTVNGVAGTPVQLGSTATGFSDHGVPTGTTVTYDVYAQNCDDTGQCVNGSAARKVATTKPAPSDAVLSSMSAAQDGYYTYPYGWTGRAVWNPSGSYTLKGTAVDWDTTSPITVRLDDSGTSRTATANGTAAGFNVANPGYGDAHAFSFGWTPMSTVPGNHSACATALNVGGGSDSAPWCWGYFVDGPPTNLAITKAANTVDVTFIDASDHETGYYLQRETAQGWVSVGSSLGATTGHGTRLSMREYASVGSGVCYRVLMTDAKGQVPSAPVCTA
ncbi:fibronectin type III domain-containing protein [Luteipulveratus flavus]|uniref:Fibronectin type-III domain-containing protein n=1 Tax=Luteipulveratus flavus TaxID=3031728 RepID=A0ABT6C4R8_9MICO|nr:hypothetical protein [Luteipulveratus sp. YIM 133296]MDF8263740.1 hypothetical protein [Luteipulveratus sp. YIM 133296]